MNNSPTQLDCSIQHTKTPQQIYTTSIIITQMPLVSRRRKAVSLADFPAQEEWPTQVVHDAGFEIILYPKYHCELNYIEMIWGWVERYHRRTFTYNYKDLKDRLPKTFDDLLPLPFVRKVFQHFLRFMSGYRQNLEGPLLDYAMTKYTSHRTVPVGVAEELSVEYQKYLKINEEKKRN